MARCIGIILALIISHTLSCEISLYPDAAESSTRTFIKHIGQNGMTVVFMNVYIEREKGVFDQYQTTDNDTFLPWRWAWASSEGAFILKLPLDYPLFSLGVLASTTAEMDVYLQADPPGCGHDAKDWTHKIARILITNVTAGVGYDASGIAPDGGGIFRSAYLESQETGVRKLIGYKWCVWSTEQWTCDMDHSSGWMITWFGPFVVVGWMYIILLTKCIAEFHLTRTKSSMSAGKVVEQLKVYVITEATRVSNRIPMASNPSELLSRYDKIGVLDILDISRNTQSKLARATRIIIVVVLFCSYYGYIAGSVFYYGSKQAMISQMDSAEEVALNVFGHIGWIYADETLGIRYYAIAELALTCLIPLMLLFIYAAQTTEYEKPPSQIHPQASSKLPPIATPAKHQLSNVVERITHERRTRLGRCVHSSPGKVLGMICMIIVLLYTLGIACPHLAYMAYFLLKGALLSMTILATWLLPAGVTLQYLRSLFLPLNSLYSYTKESFFRHIEMDVDNSNLAITHEDIMFIQRALLEKFYHRYARRRIFQCVLRAMSAIAVLILLVVVLYSSGSQALQDNSSSIIGVNMVLLLPLLARRMEATDLEEVEKRTLDREIREDIAQRGRIRNQWKKMKDLSMQKKSVSKLAREKDEKEGD